LLREGAGGGGFARACGAGDEVPGCSVICQAVLLQEAAFPLGLGSV
jgi:hypothetical protein